MLAAIPYETFPTIVLGPVHLRTFGLMVGIGVLLGAWVAGRHGEQFGVSREETYRLATILVVAGVVGARLTWDITHWDEINSPLDLIAVWNGGLQFSGGFIFAVLAGLPTFRRWSRVRRWRMIDGYGMGLALGLAIGRIGCTSVGEHFGRTTNFFLAVRYEGGVTRETTLGSVPLQKGMVFHQTAIYELLYLLVLFAVMYVLSRRRPPVAPGMLIGLYCVVYGPMRFFTDSLRVNDERTFGLTGAQWLMIAVTIAGVWILARMAPANAELEAAELEAAGDQPGDADDHELGGGDEAADADEPDATEPAADGPGAEGDAAADADEPAVDDRPTR